MFTTNNARVLKVRLRHDRSTLTGSRGRRTSPSGEPTYTDINFVDDYPEVKLVSWVDFEKVRKLRARGQDTDIDGTWSLRPFIQDQVEAVGERKLRPGDVVLFDIADTWFVLKDASVDKGMFGSVAVTTFNICRFNAPQRS